MERYRQGGRALPKIFPMRDYLSWIFTFCPARKSPLDPGFARLVVGCGCPGRGWDLAREQGMVGHMNADHSDAVTITSLLDCPARARDAGGRSLGCWLAHERCAAAVFCPGGRCRPGP